MGTTLRCHCYFNFILVQCPKQHLVQSHINIYLYVVVTLNLDLFLNNKLIISPTLLSFINGKRI